MNWELICRYRDVKPVYVELDLPTDRTPELIPEPVARSLPPLYGTEEEPDPIARVRLFMPNSTWSWYVTEYDHESKTGFGLVEGYEMDLQYFDLDELASIRGPRGERIERDLNFDPQRISDITLDQGIER